MVAPHVPSKKRGRFAALLASNSTTPVVVVVSALWVVIFLLAMWEERNKVNLPVVSEAGNGSGGNSDSDNAKPSDHATTDMTTYHGWRELAMNLARLPPDKLLKELKTKDPFGVRRFEESLVKAEIAKGSVLTQEEFQKLFPCPTDRITIPDQREKQKLEDYRANKPGTFLYFQHLRKAGGTHFCELAQKNLPSNAYASYYCMSDWDWAAEQGETMAGYLHHWSNEEITRRMKAAGHRITGNEWDNFDRQRHFELPAIFATSFRRPLDRALSQFRFECIESRGCETKDPGQYWEDDQTLYNIYTTTFADAEREEFVPFYKPDDKASQEMRANLLALALDTFIRFHLVLVMEWLAYSAPHITALLHWTDTELLTKRVRPHISQAARNDGQNVNALGAAGIAKASWIPEEYLSAEQYKAWSENLALDEILTDAARRIFLERMVCPDVQL